MEQFLNQNFAAKKTNGLTDFDYIEQKSDIPLYSILQGYDLNLEDLIQVIEFMYPTKTVENFETFTRFVVYNDELDLGIHKYLADEFEVQSPEGFYEFFYSALIGSGYDTFVYFVDRIKLDLPLRELIHFLLCDAEYTKFGAYLFQKFPYEVSEVIDCAREELGDYLDSSKKFWLNLCIIWDFDVAIIDKASDEVKDSIRQLYRQKRRRGPNY
jgi:hypothetical protein